MRSRRSPNRPCAHRSIERRAQLLPDAFGLVVHDDGGQSVQAVLHAVLDAALPSSTPPPRLDWHRRRRACSPRGPILHTHTGRGSRSRLQPRSRILLSTSTSSSTVGWHHRCALPLARPHPAAPSLAMLPRPSHATPGLPPCTRPARRPAAACSPRRPLQPLPLLCAQTSFVLPATGDTCEPPGVGLHGFGGGVGGRRCSHDVVWLVSSGHSVVPCPWMCILRISALVVTRVSCTVCLVLRLWRTVSICLLAKRRKRLSNPTRGAFYRSSMSK